MYVENVVNLKLSTLEKFKPFGVKWKPASALVSMVEPKNTYQDVLGSAA